MKVRLEVTKDGECLHQGAYEIDDSESFGEAWQDVWDELRERSLAKATSIGALMDSLHESTINELNGATIRLTKL